MGEFQFVIFCTVVVMTMLCSVMFLYDVRKLYKLQRFSQRGYGRVLSATQHRSHQCLSDGRIVLTIRYSCVVSTIISGRMMYLRVDSRKVRRVGEIVKFWYDPERPKSTIPSKPWVSTFVWLICAVAGVVVIVFA